MLLAKSMELPTIFQSRRAMPLKFERLLQTVCLICVAICYQNSLHYPKIQYQLDNIIISIEMKNFS